MPNVQIDIPIFFESTQALGYASGPIPVEEVPEPGAVFASPPSWSRAFPLHFNSNAPIVWYVEPWKSPDASHLVALYGVNCATRREAEAIAELLEATPGISFMSHL